MSENIKNLKFPKDGLAHNHIIEWWYFNGHLLDKEGNKYSFMDCLFRADTKKVKIPFFKKIPVKILYFYHSIISDIGKGKSYPKVDLFSVVSEDSFSKPKLFINHTIPFVAGGYTNRVIEEVDDFVYHLKDENVDLKLISTKEPLLVGGKGFTDVHSKKSHYYALTNLKTNGKIKINNKWINVSGKSWTDHQWANTSYTKDKWIWFSIQLDSNEEILCYKYDDGKVKTYQASISNKDGSNEHFKNVEFIPLHRKWISKKTKAKYPIDWRIKIPGKNIDLEVTASVKNQEVIFGSINYWEGPLSVIGIFNGKKVTGQGFMELVGYPSTYTNFKYTEDVIKEIFTTTIGFAKKTFFGK